MTVDAWVFGVASLVIGAIISFLVSRHYFRAANRKRELSWHSHRTRLTAVDESMGGRVALTFSGAQVTELYQFEIHVWNSGPTVIERNSIPDAQPMTLSVGTARIIDFELARVVNNANNIAVTANSDSELILEFDFMDPDEGFVLTILVDSDGGRCAATLNGAIKDRGKISRPNVRLLSESPRWHWRAVHFISALTTVAGAAVLATNTWNKWNFLDVGSYSDLLATLILVLVATIVTVSLFPLWIGKHERRLPKALEPMHQRDFSGFVGYPRAYPYITDLGEAPEEDQGAM